MADRVHWEFILQVHTIAITKLRKRTRPHYHDNCMPYVWISRSLVFNPAIGQSGATPHTLAMAASNAIVIPKTQKAAILEAFKQPYTIKTDYPVTQPSELTPGECLIKLEYTGVCHSDLHIRDNDWSNPSKLPLVGGHEGIGRVVAIGEHSNTSVKLGDRVGIKWIGKVCGKWVPFIETKF